jgi:hypothetical protein
MPLKQKHEMSNLQLYKKKERSSTPDKPKSAGAGAVGA